MSDDLYFRQLLAGRDFAVGDAVALSMRNFAYAIGDRETGEAVLVDPAYRPAELVEIARGRRDEARGRGRDALPPRPHWRDVDRPATYCGHRRAARDDGRADPRARRRGDVDHAERTGIDESALVAARRSAISSRRWRHRDHASAHAGAHAGQPVPPRRRATVQRRHALHRRVRSHRLSRRRHSSDCSCRCNERLAKVSDETVLFPGHLYSAEGSLPMGDVRERNAVSVRGEPRAVARHVWLVSVARVLAVSCAERSRHRRRRRARGMALRRIPSSRRL